MTLLIVILVFVILNMFLLINLHMKVDRIAKYYEDDGLEGMEVLPLASDLDKINKLLEKEG